MLMMMRVISLVFTLNTTKSLSVGSYLSRQQTFATFFLLAHFLPFLLYPPKTAAATKATTKQRERVLLSTCKMLDQQIWILYLIHLEFYLLGIIVVVVVFFFFFLPSIWGLSDLFLCTRIIPLHSCVCWSPGCDFRRLSRLRRRRRWRKEAFVGERRRRWWQQQQLLVLWMNGSGSRLTCWAAKLIRNFGLPTWFGWISVGVGLDELWWSWGGSMDFVDLGFGPVLCL